MVANVAMEVSIMGSNVLGCSESSCFGWAASLFWKKQKKSSLRMSRDNISQPRVFEGAGINNCKKQAERRLRHVPIRQNVLTTTLVPVDLCTCRFTCCLFYSMKEFPLED